MRKGSVLLLTSFLLSGVFATYLNTHNSSFSLLSHANTPKNKQYKLSINSPLSLKDNVFDVSTTSGNIVSFYTTGTLSNGNVINLGYGQYIKNILPISNISSIVVDYSGDQLLYITSNDIVNTVSGVTDKIYDDVPLELDPIGYFALKSMGRTLIHNIEINYYCDIPIPSNYEANKNKPSYEYKQYNIETIVSDNIIVNVVNSSYPNNVVYFSYSLSPNYVLYGLEIYRKSDGLPIRYNSNHFVMDYDDVVIEAKACQYDPYKRTYSEMISDSHFRNGFSVWGTNNLNPQKVGTLTYNGSAETNGIGQTTSTSAYWNFCQWWCSNDVMNSGYSYADGFHCYADNTRRLAINTTTSEVNFDLNTATIYQSDYGEMLLNQGNWPHILLEQSFSPNTLQYVSDIENEGKDIKLKCDFAVTWNDKKFHDPRMIADCAQFNWYVKLSYYQRSGKSLPSNIDNVRYMWVGFPLYDDRFLDGIPEYRAADKGQPGATGAYIYNVASRNVINETFQMNKTYQLDFEITPYLHSAYNYAKDSGYLVGIDYEDLIIDYMNIGWEIYSGRVVNSFFKNCNCYIS